MTGQKNILCVSNTTWEGFYTKSTVQIMSLLAEKNKVLFVEYPFTIKDMISSLAGKGRAPVSRMAGFSRRLVTKHPVPGVQVYHLVVPPVFPIEFIKIDSLYRLFLKINTSIYARSVRRSLRKLKMDTPICINAYNSIYGNNLIGSFNEKAHIFYCYDGPNSGRYGQKAVIADQGFAARADGVIVTSEFLATSLRPFNSEIHVVKNGVDFGLFSPFAKTEPNKIATRKKACYIGSIDQRFDTDTVEFAIKSLPEFDFEFTGDLMNKSVAHRLSNYPNVRFCPPVKPEEVPDLLSKCDVGLIPYLCNDYTKNIYPLKINEYLSVGVPVVLTSFADLPEFNQIVRFTKGREEFRDAVAGETESDNTDRIRERIRFASDNSWEKRAMLFEEIIDIIIENKK